MEQYDKEVLGMYNYILVRETIDRETKWWDWGMRIHSATYSSLVYCNRIYL